MFLMTYMELSVENMVIDEFVVHHVNKHIINQHFINRNLIEISTIFSISFYWNFKSKSKLGDKRKAETKTFFEK